MQQALDQGDSAALVARQDELLHVSGAEMSEGGKGFGPEDSRRILDTFFRAGSKPRVDGYFVATSADQVGLACLGVVTRGWTGTVAAPTDLPGPAYGESWPASALPSPPTSTVPDAVAVLTRGVHMGAT